MGSDSPNPERPELRLARIEYRLAQSYLTDDEKEFNAAQERLARSSARFIRARDALSALEETHV